MNGLSVDINTLKKGEANLGTSIMAVTYDGGVLIGADSRTTTGSFIANRVTDKLTQLHGKIYCCRSGSAADTQTVADIIKHSLNQYQFGNATQPSVKVATALAQEIIYTNKDALHASLIVAGYDEKLGGQVYSLPLGGSVHQQEFAIAGSGSSYIYGYTSEHWKPNMTKDEAVEFVKRSLAQAIQWDGSSGGVIRMVALNSGPIERYLFLPGEY